MKEKEKQDLALLISQIKRGAEEILIAQPRRLKPDYLGPTKLGPVSFCPRCGETYPISMGSPCSACRGESPYR